MSHSLLQAVLLAFAFGAVSCLATPVVRHEVLQAASLDKSATGCTFSGSDGASLVSKSKSSCSTIVLSSLAVPAGMTLDLTKLQDGTHVMFEGTTTFGYKEWDGPLVSVSGNRITVTGAPGSVLDGGGARWWDGQGKNGGKTKPKFFYAHKMTSSTISNIKIKDSPIQVFSIDQASNLNLNTITIDNSAGDSRHGHNTDGFNVGSSRGINIDRATVHSQDDCLAVNSGSDITFSNGYCSGGHGISIGSVGGHSDNSVSNVLVTNSKVVNSENGVRIKTVSGATGSVRGVTYRGITLSGITKHGIVIEQDYKNGGPTGIPTNGVSITGLTLNGVTGSVSSSATKIHILCGSGSCSNWSWKGVSISGGKKSSSCKNVPSGATC
ncbi:glycoside hydrolase family 28 protein [Pseudocercospora fijiensis CIRAD86]|uniref:endo-polygalacturonase n=1 Tax=Pseudocercospora fijiensis (strain CIRAD86) TaxID=383855 RepID=M3AQA4_PSEFD|nr:glycoside hydrolase family 28 protein [Pseudocercospora fijiensis CIRAD86]EME86776.1 glycoside hydrolase family 28 protein [Pseudocercospora fijiensis CIRAD86]